MPRAPQVIPQSPPPPIAERTLSEQRDVVLLNEDAVMDMYNLSFNEFYKRIVQACRKHFQDDHTSLAFIKERVIVLDTKKNITSIVKIILAKATISNVYYLMAKNDKLVKNL